MRNIRFRRAGINQLRRLIVNASYWALGIEEDVPENSIVEIAGEFNPAMFGFGDFRQGMKPADYKKIITFTEIYI